MVSSDALDFTPSNWSTVQTVTVTGVNDDVDNEGDVRLVEITHTSSGGGYEYVAPVIVDVTVMDNDGGAPVEGTDPDDPDAKGLTFEPSTAITVDENGGRKTYTVKLNTEPTGNVTLNLSSN